ncbi:MAG: adenine phosphoribosyltransferase [Planctomycetota bacterium]
MDQLLSLIHDVPDYPKPGVVFKDFTPLLADPCALALAVELMANPYRNQQVDIVVGAESRGFIFGTAVAQSLSAGFVPIRKPGKLPRHVHGTDYDLEYGSDRLEIHADALQEGTRVLIVDDLLATGGTLKACGTLIRDHAQASIVGITVLIELKHLRGAEGLDDFGQLHAVLSI